MLKESSDLLLDLKEVTTATGLSMTDKERLDIINRIYGEVLEYKNLTWYYTRKNIGVSYLRSKKKGMPHEYSPCTGHTTSVTGNHSSIKSIKKTMLLLSIDWTNLHELLRSLYGEMMPLCEKMAGVARGWRASERCSMWPTGYGNRSHGQSR